MSWTEKVILLLFVIFTFSEAGRLKCEVVICPKCDFRSSDTYANYALRMLRLKGPADGSCHSDSVKYIHEGGDYNLSYNACCCMPVLPTSPVQYNPQDPNFTVCPDNIGIRKDELISDYYTKVAAIQKDAPENGWCRAGTFKYIFAKDIIGTSHNTCACFINNLAFIPESSSSSSSSTSSSSSNEELKG